MNNKDDLDTISIPELGMENSGDEDGLDLDVDMDKQADDLFERSDDEPDRDGEGKRQRVAAITRPLEAGGGAMGNPGPTKLAGVRGAMAAPADEASPRRNTHVFTLH